MKYRKASLLSRVHHRLIRRSQGSRKSNDSETSWTKRTHSIHSAERVAICDAITFACTNGDTSGRSSEGCTVQEGDEYTREILVEVCEEHRVAALHDDGYSCNGY